MTTIEGRWTPGEVSRLRRRLDLARSKREDANDCAAVAEVAADFGISSSKVREVLSRADRIEAAKKASYASDAIGAGIARVDIYSQKRAGIIERLETGLHPSAYWRDPREAGAPARRVDPVPLAHSLAAACVWLRHHPVGRCDVSGDLLWCLVMQERCSEEAERVQSALVSAWLDLHGQTLVHTLSKQAAIEDAAAVLVARCVTGVVAARKIRLHWQVWRKLQESGERMLWALADTASRRAVSALR